MTSLTKPKVPVSSILEFAEGADTTTHKEVKKTSRTTAGMVPLGDIRLTVNVRADIHQRLKIRAVQERTTVGDLIEEWVEDWQ
jgi:hypothetical protein